MMKLVLTFSGNPRARAIVRSQVLPDGEGQSWTPLRLSQRWPQLLRLVDL